MYVMGKVRTQMARENIPREMFRLVMNGKKSKRVKRLEEIFEFLSFAVKSYLRAMFFKCCQLRYTQIKCGCGCVLLYFDCLYLLNIRSKTFKNYILVDSV